MSVYTCVYLEGSHAELDTQAQVNVEVVGQKIEEHVVCAKQRDEEEAGLSQASVAQKKRNKRQEVKIPEGVIKRMSNPNAAPDSIMHADTIMIRCQSRG